MFRNNSRKNKTFFVVVMQVNGKNVYGFSEDNRTFYSKPILKINYQTTYNFNIDTVGHPFYITTNKNGGNNNLDGAISIKSSNNYRKSNTGVENGILTWSPTKSHSMTELYYQCDYHKDMGNRIKFVKMIL